MIRNIKYFTLKNVYTGEVISMSQEALLENLNRDRSDEWTVYTANDSFMEIWEAIHDFTEYELLAVDYGLYSATYLVSNSGKILDSKQIALKQMKEVL